jgi:phosphonate transport system substrate-binding protein
MARLPFAMPPSLGHERAGQLCRSLRTFLNERTGHDFDVYVAEDYRAIEEDLSKGIAVAAWAPPDICRRVTQAGGQQLLWIERHGASSYRSALVCRKGDPILLDSLEAFRAAWVSASSTGGYLLAREWLSKQGKSIHDFRDTTFCGSYSAALSAVLDFEADVTAVFASSEDSPAPYSALDELHHEDRERLDVLAFTHETPNDGIVVGPSCPDVLRDALRLALVGAGEDEGGSQLVARVFNATGFAEA